MSNKETQMKTETTKVKVKVQEITPAMVDKAYVSRKGKAGSCCCGCSGTYTEAPAAGDETDLAKCNAAEVLRVLRLVQAEDATGNVDVGGSYVAAVVNKRDVIVYLKDDRFEAVR